MAAVMKTLKGIRNHWKKSIFAGILLGIGTKYGLDKYECDQIMQAYCEEAKKYGMQPIDPTDRPRHVTVLLNPVAGNSKGKAKFEKYAVPLLHLAGIKVSIVKTEHEGQARALMEVMDNTDAVIVSGGDGTVMEVVTGLLRREDQKQAINNFPIGIIPLGNHNSMSEKLFRAFSNNDARFIGKSVMSVIRQTKRNVDVMRISHTEGKPIFAVSHLEWSLYRDTNDKIPKYWYFGPLKSKVAYVSEALRNWPRAKHGTVSFTPPCDGCSKCFTEEKTETVQSVRWWHAFLPRTSNQSVAGKNIVDYSKVVNENCGVWTDVEFKTVNLRVDVNGSDSFLVLGVAPSEISRGEFIKEGWNQNSAESESVYENIREERAKSVKIYPSEHDLAKEWFSIDNENFEVRPVEIEILRKKIQIYCPETHSVKI